jgi:simple sugar transport system permease protein
MSSEFPVNLLALVLVFVAVVAVVVTLRGTRWGLQLRATGKNPRSALLLGVPTTRSAMSALMVCGALAGIAGAYRVLFTYSSLRPFVSGGIGFLALLVVLLVAVRALWTPFVALAFAVILAGSTRLRVALQLDQSLAGVLQGILVLFVLIATGLRQRWMERRQPTETPEVMPEQPFQPISTRDPEVVNE